MQLNNNIKEKIFVKDTNALPINQAHIPLGMIRSVEKATIPQPLHSVGMQPNY